jgi:hypothetical protein
VRSRKEMRIRKRRRKIASTCCEEEEPEVHKPVNQVQKIKAPEECITQ